MKKANERCCDGHSALNVMYQNVFTWFDRCFVVASKVAPELWFTQLHTVDMSRSDTGLLYRLTHLPSPVLNAFNYHGSGLTLWILNRLLTVAFAGAQVPGF